MANSDAREGGIHTWMASVKASMDNDPCRQLFEDQVQTHAFIFLDDYLDHILAGPKQGPIIELVKTPARKKNVPRRTKAAATASAKVETTTLFSLDSHSASKDVPVNSFHKALLQAGEASSTRNALDPPKFPNNQPLALNILAEKMHGRSDSDQLNSVPEITVSAAPDSQIAVMPPQYRPGIELSVISEGDESLERNPVDIPLLSPIASDYDELPGIVREPPATQDDADIIRTSYKSKEHPSLDAQSSVPFDSPRQVKSSQVQTNNHTEPLLSAVATRSLGNLERNAFTSPLPAVPVSNSISILHAISVPLNDSSPKKLAQKTSIAGFPVLPAPSPLRKSMRPVQEVLASSTLPTTAPVPFPLGKRTSWLMKAREAKAMEGSSSLPSTSAISTAVPAVLTAVKRKSGEMLDSLLSISEWDKDQRKQKIAKSTEAKIAPSTLKETEIIDHRDSTPTQNGPGYAMEVDEHITHVNTAEEGCIHLFKRTVEGLGARAGTSTGKSLGGLAAAALAEARAAAEARVAERNKVNGGSRNLDVPSDDDMFDPEALDAPLEPDVAVSVPVLQIEVTERQLSLSSLAVDTTQFDEPEPSRKETREMDIGRLNSNDDSVSTTPANTPPSKGSSGFVKPAGPVFNKPPPPPVFMPPAPKPPSMVLGHSKDMMSSFPSGHFTLSTALPLGIPAKLAPPSTFPSLVQATLQFSPQPSTFPGLTFDKRNEIPTPHTCTQDILHTIDSQPDNLQPTPASVDDDDDSWPLEEKLAAGEPEWRPFDFSNVDKEDTWSSLPTESQGPTRRLTAEKNAGSPPLFNDANVEVEMNNETDGADHESIGISDSEPSFMAAGELEDIADAGTAYPDHVEPSVRATSQVSATSTSTYQPSFFSQATKLVNSVLGGGKKAKPELKSLQLAAAAAKKQKEEEDKKTRRLKDMEARRQVAIAKKEEKNRLLEEEKKSKEELERRKREREDNTDRRPLKPSALVKKVEDDAAKKRKLGPEIEKKPEGKKPPSKDRKDFIPLAKSAATPSTKVASQKAVKPISTALLSSAAYNTTQNVPPALSVKPVIPEPKPFKATSSSLKGKAKAKFQEDDIGDRLPSTVVQSQMAARAKAQMQAAKATPEVPSELIELPEINSEYSDSEDEDRVRAFDPPDWAQSPELRQALEMQSTVNPDDIFGTIRPLRMDEVFRTRQSRFRARTSSANWSGSDRLTVEEIREYERRMGFQPSPVS